MLENARLKGVEVLTRLKAAGAGSGIGFGMHGSPSLARNRSRSLPRLHPGFKTARSTKSMKRPDDGNE